MKKARLPDGQVILAKQYNKEAHGCELRCADPNCEAGMVFRRESLTHGAQSLRTAAFVSKSIKEHKADCTEHENFAIMAKGKKSIEQGLAEGKTIVLNVNMNLTGLFNMTVKDAVFKPSTLKRGNYVTAAAKNVEDVLELIETIRAKGGEAGLDKTVVNYKGDVMPVKEFQVDTRDQFRDLLNKVYKAETDAEKFKRPKKDYPRLIKFTATKNTREREGGVLRGTPRTFSYDNGNKIILLQVADVPPEFQQTLRGENVHMLATPSLGLDEARAAYQKLQSGKNQTIFLNLHWKVVGAHQFTPMEEPEAAPAAPVEKTAAEAPATQTQPPQAQQQNLFKP